MIAPAILLWLATWRPWTCNHATNTYYNPLGRKVCRTCAAAARARYENRTTA